MKGKMRLSRRAKRVMYPMLGLAVVLFLASAFMLFQLGVSAFPGGAIVDGRYWVSNHGKVIELTSTEYWTSYIVTASTAATVVLYLILAFCFYASGDIVNEESPTH